MLCKVCNTRIRGDRSSCPNCGCHSLSASANVDPGGAENLPHLEMQIDPNDPLQEQLEVVELNEPTAIEVEVDMVLDEATAAELDTADDVGFENLEERDDGPEIVQDPPPAAVAPADLGTPDATTVRRLLALKPEILEPGLEIYRNEKGTPLGAGYTSAVGEIDLLARDVDGGLVVVMVAEPHEGAGLVSAVLERIGWVRKHLGGGAKRVRGIVLMDRPRDALAYAAAAVADTVCFKIYQVSLSFDDLDY